MTKRSTTTKKKTKIIITNNMDPIKFYKAIGLGTEELRAKYTASFNVLDEPGKKKTIFIESGSDSKILKESKDA